MMLSSEGNNLMPPRRDLQLTWRQMVRLPEDWGERVEKLAKVRAQTIGAMLREIVREGLERIEQEEAEHEH